MKRLILLPLLIVLCQLAGCATYRTPGAAADLTGIEGYKVREAFERRPAAHFPAHVAIVRIQATGYRNGNDHVAAYGGGAYCVLTTREIEQDEDLARLTQLPQLAGLAPLNRLVLPPRFNSFDDLRQAAAAVQADMLVIYTLDTSFRVRDKDIGPVRTFSLGILSRDQATVTTTASAAIFDTRSGFIYGLAEATSSRDKKTNAWLTEDVVDDFRQQTEREAFSRLVDEVVKLWPGIVAEHAS